FAHVRGIQHEATARAIRELPNLPGYIREALETDQACRRFAEQVYKYKDFIYIGRDIDYPIALEGALKLKEISYIHAEGYPSGELKHGPTALVNEDLPVVVVATHDEDDPASMLLYEKSLSSLREFVQREIPVIAVATRS